METKSNMENKRARFKSWKGNENVILEEIYHMDVDDIDSGAGVDCHQSCICDPAFITDSSSNNSVSGDSCGYNDLTHRDCGQQDFKWDSDNSYQNMDEAEAVYTPTESLQSQVGVTGQGIHPRYRVDRPVKNTSTDSLALTKDCQSTDCLFDKPSINKVVIINGRIEPYHVHRLPKTNRQNSIPKHYIDECENYSNKSQNLSDLYSYSFIEKGPSKKIRSILKKNEEMKNNSNTKKKVTFTFNRYDDENTKARNNMNISSSPNRTILNCITNTNTPSISPPTDDQNTNSETTVTPLTTETECNIFDKVIERDSFLNNHLYDGNENIQSKLSNKTLDGSISTASELENIHHHPDLPLNPFENDSLSEINCSSGNSNLRHINEEEIEKETFDEEKIFKIEGSISEKYDNVKKLVSSCSIGIQSDFDRNTTTKAGFSLNLKAPTQELDESQTENKFFSQENEYSSFIKDLVTGSGDRLANFLIRLSSEISSEASQEKLQRALMNAFFGHQEIINSKNLLQVNNEETKMVSDNENNQMTAIDEIFLQNLDRNTNMALETKMKPSKHKNIGRSMTNCQPNEILDTNSFKEDCFIKAKKSMSLINIHELHPRASYSKDGYLGNRLTTSSVSKLYNKRNACIEPDGPLINNNGDKNEKTIGKLHEQMAELRESIENIRNKESTIHIENAQIWVNDSKSYEWITPSDQIWAKMRKSKKITEEEILASQLNKTKDTYSQTIVTAGIDLGDYLPREITKETENKTEIHIHSNNKNEEINIKVNEKKKHMKDLVLAVEPKENQTMYLPNIQVNPKGNENLNEERGRIYVEHYDAPFNAIVEDDRKLPYLKRGKYEFEIFEQIDEPVIAESSVKNLLNKITDQMTTLKLNSLQNYQKRSRNTQSSKLKTIKNATDEKPASGNLFQLFLNKFSRSNFGSQNSSNGYANSKQYMGLKNQFSIFNSIFPTKCKGSSQIDNDLHLGLHSVNGYKRKHFSVNSIKCDDSSISLCDDNQWPDVKKTKYPNGMVHFGPLARMPEPEMAVTSDRQSKELDSCPDPCFREFHEYSYNKHMVKTSVSRNINNLSKTEMSLEKFSETEQKIYHWWSEVENI